VLGFEISGWDYITFLTLAIVGFSFVLFVIWLGGLPGRIAIARKHPDADAVRVMGWAGLLAVVPWIQAFIWAFKPTDIIDIRRFPAEERVAIDEVIARLRGESPAEGDASPAKDDASPAKDDDKPGH
jgi:hypothetical protein